MVATLLEGRRFARIYGYRKTMNYQCFVTPEGTLVW